MPPSLVLPLVPAPAAPVLHAVHLPVRSLLPYNKLPVPNQTTVPFLPLHAVPLRSELPRQLYRPPLLQGLLHCQVELYAVRADLQDAVECECGHLVWLSAGADRLCADGVALAAVP